MIDDPQDNASSRRDGMDGTDRAFPDYAIKMNDGGSAAADAPTICPHDGSRLVPGQPCIVCQIAGRAPGNVPPAPLGSFDPSNPPASTPAQPDADAAELAPLAHLVPAKPDIGKPVDDPAEAPPVAHDPEPEAAPPPPPPPPPAAAQPVAAADPPPPGNDIVRGVDEEEPDAEQLAQEAARFRTELNAIKEDGIFALMLIGHSAAGKTWLLNRLKYELTEMSPGLSCSPRHVSDGDRAPRTTEMRVHRFSYPGEGAKDFAIIDIPGDRLKAFLTLEYAQANVVIEAMAVARALIIAIPAELTFLSNQYVALEKSAQRLGGLTPELMRKRFGMEQSDQGEVDALLRYIREAIAGDGHLKNFENGLIEMAKVVSYVRHNQLEMSQEGIANADLTQARIDEFLRRNKIQPFGGKDGLDLPVFVALTQSDGFLPLLRVHPEADIRHIDEDMFERRHSGFIRALFSSAPEVFEESCRHVDDPRWLLQKHRARFLRALDYWMPLNRIDFVAAFYGHGGNDTIDYSDPHFGVQPLLEWMQQVHFLKRMRDNAKTRVKAKVRPDALVRAMKRRGMLEGRVEANPLDFGDDFEGATA